MIVLVKNDALKKVNKMFSYLGIFSFISLITSYFFDIRHRTIPLLHLYSLAFLIYITSVLQIEIMLRNSYSAWPNGEQYMCFKY